jgi:hypothetical protein
LSIREQINNLPDEQVADLEAKLHAKDGTITSLRADLKRALKRCGELSGALDSIASLSQDKRALSRPVKAMSRASSVHSAIPVIAWSDWHVAEIVTSRKTNGRNRYNPDIARTRSRKLCDNTLRLLNNARQNVAIDEAVLVLGGDFITGYLHEELAQTNAMGPMEESYFAQGLLEEELGRFIDSAKLSKLRIVCHRGNHGRTTRKVQFKNDYETSYETWIYWNLRDRISNSVTEWCIPEADVNYTTLITGHQLRTMHGHQIKYGGGVGGIAVPLNRWIAKQDQTTYAINTVLGHFHSFEPSSRFAINGSLKGWDEFAQSKGFPFEHPSQLMQLFDCKRKQFTARFPIFCE